MQAAASALVHEGNGDEGHDDHDGADADGGVLGVRLGQARRDEQVGRVVEDGVDPGQLLRQLQDVGVIPDFGQVLHVIEESTLLATLQLAIQPNLSLVLKY